MNEIKVTTLDKNMGFPQPVRVNNEENAMVQIEQARAVAEAQTKFVMAKRFPRNENECYSAIIQSCKRPGVAEQAIYAYPKGGTLVTGISIRLAEVMAQRWGNIEFGVRVISQGSGVSMMQAYAIDLETNLHKKSDFHVAHVRDTKQGPKKLTDERDIYEMGANQGARRMRACILALLPSDVKEDAFDQCKKTLETSDIPIQEQVKKMILAFDEYGVKVEHLEKRLGHNLNSVIPAEMVTLKSIFRSIKEGHAGREKFFDIGLKGETAEAAIDKILEGKKKKPPINLETGEVTKDDQKQE